MSYIELSFSPDADPAKVEVLSRDHRQVRGLNLRRSKRWSMCFPGVGGPYELPLIDRLGRFTGASVYTLACEPADVLSITVSTIFGRLKRYASAHCKNSIVNRYQRVILRAAAYYAISKNSYFMDRLLFLLRTLEKNGRSVHKLTLKFVAKGNADKRFVYGQVCYQTNWLIFRACKPRDKLPLLKKCDRISPGFLGSPGSFRRGIVRSTTTKFAENVAMVGRSTG